MISVLATILTLSLFATTSAQASFVCGSMNLFSKDMQWMRSFVKDYSLGWRGNSGEIQCGMSGEDFRLCRKCESFLTSAQAKSLNLMLSPPKYKSWSSRWNQEKNLGEVQLSESDFYLEKRMNHVRSGETRDQFETRNNSQWGESYLFVHRELYKMVQFEMTVSGHPCLTPLEAIPLKWNDKNWPAPKKNAAQDLLKKAREESDALSDPKLLQSMTLNQLGIQLESLAKTLATAYQDPQEVLDKKCQGPETTNPQCDNLLSPQSAPANKYFWMIHAYTDKFVGKWLNANGYKEISKDCAGREKCYQWQGTYTATYPF